MHYIEYQRMSADKAQGREDIMLLIELLGQLFYRARKGIAREIHEYIGYQREIVSAVKIRSCDANGVECRKRGYIQRQGCKNEVYAVGEMHEKHPHHEPYRSSCRSL